jgi:sugar lactone lactonase YvrE
MVKRDRRWVVIVGFLLIATACQSATTTPSPTPGPTLSASPLAACPAAPAPAGPQILLQNQPGPDDLVFDNDGRLLISDISKGTVSALRADGSLEQIAGGLSAPEGMVIAADGRILVAEQGRNRIVAIDPQTRAVTPWRTFPNRTGRDGIDGIGPLLPAKDALGNLLPTGDNVIVPDSPNGVVWRVTPDGKTATQIATGMNRPAGGGIDANGRIFIADEGGPVWVLDPSKHRFATLPTPDDVLVGRGGHVFVNTLGDNAIHELDAQGHQVAVISGIQQPQGIALDDADNLYYTEFTKARVGRIVRTFVLDPAKVTRIGPGHYLICPVVRRALGFSTPLGLLTGSSRITAILRLVQPGTDSSGAIEVQTTEPSLGITVSDGGLLSESQTVSLSP